MMPFDIRAENSYRLFSHKLKMFLIASYNDTFLLPNFLPPVLLSFFFFILFLFLFFFYSSFMLVGSFSLLFCVVLVLL